MGSAVLKMSIRKRGKDLPLKASPSTNVHMTVSMIMCRKTQQWYTLFCNFFFSAAAKSGAGDMGMPGVRPSGYIVSALRFWFVDQLISNLHTSIILRISSLSSKLGKIRNNISCKATPNWCLVQRNRRSDFCRFHIFLFKSGKNHFRSGIFRIFCYR